MPTVKKTTSSLRATTKQSSSVKTPTKIAASSVRTRTPRNDGMSVPVYSLTGRATGTLVLPKEIFGVKVSKSLLSQAMRVYMTNQKNLTASTKTRGQVRGSTAKVWRQKGTGRARHGARTAPIFVGGGITFGPRLRNVRLDLPQKMKKAALLNSLSSKALDKQVIGLTGLEKATGKTKELFDLMKKVTALKSALIVTPEKIDKVVRAVRNIKGVDVLPVSQLNAFDVLRHQNLLLTKEAVEKLK